MSEWRNCILGDVVTIVDCEHKTAPLVDKSEYISVRTSNISNGKIDFDKSNRVSKGTYDEWTRRLQPQENDIILAREAPVGEVGWIPYGKKVCLGQRTVLIRVKDGAIDPKYLLYYLVSDEVKFDLISRSTGSVVEHLNVKDIRGFELNIHFNLLEQKAIASILSSLDDKIDLLHRQNATLEAMAETLFRQWFVEEAKEEWEETRLDQHLEVYRGLSYKGSGLSEKGFGLPMHNLNSVYEGGGYKSDGIKYYTGEYKERHLVNPGDIIVTNTEQGHEFRLIGFPAVVPDTFGDLGLFSQHIYKLSLLKSSYLSNQFVYYLLMTSSVREQITAATNGSTVNMLAIDGLQRPEFKLPPKQKVKQFTEAVDSYWKKKYLNEKQIHSLNSLRDTLLLKLMSGDLKLSI